MLLRKTPFFARRSSSPHCLRGTIFLPSSSFHSVRSIEPGVRAVEKGGEGGEGGRKVLHLTLFMVDSSNLTSVKEIGRKGGGGRVGKGRIRRFDHCVMVRVLGRQTTTLMPLEW